MRSNKGFTLVEILIVVIILGILAAIVIPQFTEASNDARVSALKSDLQTMRSQVELYKIQHLDDLPGLQADGSINDTNFVEDMTEQTDQDGTSGTTFGPYLQSFPGNPFVDPAVGPTIVSGAGAPNADGASGWWLDTDTGRVSPNDAEGYAGL